VKEEPKLDEITAPVAEETKVGEATTMDTAADSGIPEAPPMDIPMAPPMDGVPDAPDMGAPTPARRKLKALHWDTLSG
jgi:hypothetical protein